jgi:hypothetical protein
MAERCPIRKLAKDHGYRDCGKLCNDFNKCPYLGDDGLFPKKEIAPIYIPEFESDPTIHDES